MALQNLVRLLLPKEDHFFDFLEQQAALAHEGAIALRKMCDGDTDAVRAEVKAIEKRGDKVNHDVEDALAKTFVTPIDREDIHKLSSMLDDILDRAHGTASAFDMFSIDKPTEAVQAFMALLVKTTEQISTMMPGLRKQDWDAIREDTRALKLLEKEGDEIYRTAMKRLFADTSIGARDLIREKEVIELLESAVDTCEDVAEFLTNLAVKHG
jgi:predicted phosphate transport protein (TIGR00153 family)